MMRIIEVKTSLPGAVVAEALKKNECLLKVANIKERITWGDCCECVYYDKPCGAYGKYRVPIMRMVWEDLSYLWKRVFGHKAPAYGVGAKEGTEFTKIIERSSIKAFGNESSHENAGMTAREIKSIEREGIDINA